jgi:hypothetical protein
MGPINWVASCVTELDDTLPHFTGVQWDSVRGTHGVSTEAYVWKTTCVMLSGYFPCKVDH